MTAAMRTPDFDTTHTTSMWGEETMVPAFDTGESATSCRVWRSETLGD